MGQHDHQDEEVLCEVFSEESLSRSDSVDHLSLHHLDDGNVEERFRVDRRKLEAMILGGPPQSCDLDLRLPLTSDGCVMTAEAFFRKIMDETETEIRYPKFLKAGARSKKDPHVRVVGSAEAVRLAGSLVRQELDPPNKVTMKMDVPWTHHSHIIGKGGNTIQPVVKKTGVSIHFPDGNKSNEMRKSNQVSINSRGEDLQGLEEARQAIRSLTPLIFNFTLSASVQFCSGVNITMLVLHVQSTYNVQVELRVMEEMTLVGVVRGSELEAKRVMEATRYILQAYCCSLANQVPIQMTVEVSPQHHAFVLGRNNEHIKRIMHRTSTNITFPDWNDSSLLPVKKSTVTISGSIDNVYLARQNIIGSLPLVLMFDLVAGAVVEMVEVSQMMQMLDVQIILKSCRMDGRRPVVVKGAERNAENVYEAWRMLCKVESATPKAHVPASYHILNSASSQSNITSCLGLGGWVGGGSGDSSPLPSPTSTPTPSTPHLHPLSNTSLWGGLTSSSTTTTLLPHPPRLDPVSPTSSFYSGNPFCNGALTYNNQHNLCSFMRNSSCILPPLLPYTGGGSSTGSGGVNLDTFVKSMKGITLNSGDISCGTSSNSGSSLSSPSHSPRDSPPDQTLLAPTTTSTTPSDNAPTAASSATTHFPEDTPQPSTGMDALSALLKDIDWRAPGCEKKHMERVAAQKMTLSDYSSKKVEAARAMKQDVGSNPRIPTSSWSGYGFSKSMPGFMIRQKLQEAKESVQNGVGGSGLEEWGDTWQQKNDSGGGGGGGGGGGTGLASFPTTTTATSTTPPPPSQPVTSLQYRNNMSQFSLGGDKVLGGLGVRPSVNLSASNFMDCVLPRRDRDTLTSASSSALHNPSSSSSSSSSQHLDVISILTDLQLPQYIDVFVGQEVDLSMFMSLEDYDLKELGITIFGHRKRILMAIKDLSSKSSLFGSGVGGCSGGLGGMVSRVDHHLHHHPSTLRDSSTVSSATSSSTWN